MKQPAGKPRSLAQSIVEYDGLDVERIGAPRGVFVDVYHRLIRMSWPRFFAVFAALFLVSNLFFAMFYWADLAGLVSSEHDALHPPFLRAFFFSVHTIATVGYGNVAPRDIFTNIVVVVEIACGIMMIAISSGLMFARFSRPIARILFSSVAVVSPFEGVPTLKFRAANQRNNFILEANVRLSLLHTEHHNGQQFRRFHDLDLVRSSNPVFALSWLVMHKIDESSPLYGIDGETFAREGHEIVVLMTGFDASMAQQIHARHAYGPSTILWDHEFVDILNVGPSGRRQLDYRRFHDAEPLPAPAIKGA